MSDDWLTSELQEKPRRAVSYFIGALRAIPIFGTLALGLALMLLLRLVEGPVFRGRRPLTQWITPLVCRSVLFFLGLRVIRYGAPDPKAQMSVANHSTWLDIFVLNSARKLYFVSKSEVAGWPGIGWLARATGTVFIRRIRTEARAHVDEFKNRLSLDHHLMFFPEGTSTDGQRVLDFKPTLFASVSGKPYAIQPISIKYIAPKGTDTRFYGWWGDMDFAPSMMRMLLAVPHGRVEVRYLPVLDVETLNRKETAKQLCTAVRTGFDSGG